MPTEVICLWTLQSAASAARRSHDTTTAADVGGATLWPPASSSAAVGLGPAAGGGGATQPLPPTSVARVTTCVHWGAGWPIDAVTAAQWHRRVEWCTGTINTLAIQTLCRCISSAILLRAGAPGAACSQATRHMTGINCHISFICLDISDDIWLVYDCMYHLYDTMSYPVIWQVYDGHMTTYVIYLSYTCHIYVISLDPT